MRDDCVMAVLGGTVDRWYCTVVFRSVRTNSWVRVAGRTYPVHVNIGVFCIFSSSSPGCLARYHCVEEVGGRGAV